MNALDLRIGNLAQWEDESHNIVKITSIFQQSDQYFIYYDEINKKEPSGYALLDEFIPIHLSEEWLLKAGFKNYSENKNVWFITTFEIWKHSKNGKFNLNCNISQIEIKYVHQLQNLYFALTGAELTFKI